MNAQPQKKPRMTAEKYLEFDNNSDIKYEYFDGDIFAMTGGSLNHNQISINIASQLKNTLRGSPCRPLASDMRVKVNEIDKYTYPDIVVVCGNIELEKVKGVETLLNPVVIIEILSDSTEAYDRGKNSPIIGLFLHFVSTFLCLKIIAMWNYSLVVIAGFGRFWTHVWIWSDHSQLSLLIVNCCFPISMNWLSLGLTSIPIGSNKEKSKLDTQTSK